MTIDEDLIQRIKVGAIFFLQVYKVTTGTLLALFVPQSCGEQICSLTENYENEEPYHKTVLYYQMFSWCTFFLYYMMELRREHWAIKYLDIDNDKPDNALKEIIIQEPVLDSKMDKLNKTYYRLLVFNCSVYFGNILLTIKLLKDGYHSMSTISCFASFVLLVLMKLYNSLVVAHESVKNDKMMSAYMSEFVSFNVLDADYVEDKKKLLEEGVEDEGVKEDEVKEDEVKEDEVTLEEIIPVIVEKQFLFKITILFDETITLFIILSNEICDTLLDKRGNCIVPNCKLWFDGCDLCEINQGKLLCPYRKVQCFVIQSYGCRDANYDPTPCRQLACNLYCKYGFIQDKEGCNICQCDNTPPIYNHQEYTHHHISLQFISEWVKDRLGLHERWVLYN